MQFCQCFEVEVSFGYFNITAKQQRKTAAVEKNPEKTTS